MRTLKTLNRRLLWLLLAQGFSLSVSLTAVWFLLRQPADVPKPAVVVPFRPTGAEVRREWPGNPWRTHMQCLDPEFKRYATTEPNGTIRVRQVEDDAELAVLTGSGLSVEWILRFSPNGQQLLAAYGSTGRVVLWDLASRRAVLTNQAHHFAADFSSDGRTLALATSGRLVLIDLERRQVMRTLRITTTVPHSLRFSPDAQTLALTTLSRPVVEFVAVDGTGVFAWQTPAVIRSLDWSPDGHTVAAPAADGSVILYDVTQRQVAATLAAHRGVVSHTRFSPDGQVLATAGWDKMLRLWRVGEGEAFFEQRTEPPFLEFSRDSRQLGLVKTDTRLGILRLTGPASDRP